MNLLTKITLQNVNTYFFELGSRLKEFRRYKREMDIYLSTDFNVFNQFKPDENKLSDIIADMFDPCGSHGQKDTFLREFIYTIDNMDPNLNGCKVRRESFTDLIEKSARKIDITIESKHFAIGIENKPWAREGNGQALDYLTHLQNKPQKTIKLVYLLGNGQPPKSVTDDKDLIIYPYRSCFLEFLRNCHKECCSDRYRWFLHDFIKFVESEFLAN